jgi:hypothetical protein
MKVIYTLVLTMLFYSSSSSAEFEMGVNLVNDGSFVNIINHTARYNNVSEFDEHGWPKTDFDLVLLDGRPATEWTGNIDDPEQYRVDYSGIYKASFDGLADVTVSGTSVSIENLEYNSDENKTYFEVNVGGSQNSNHALVFLSFKNTRKSPKSISNVGVTNLKVVRPGYELDSKKTFTDEYIALCKSADFACYRFYNVQNIWNGEPTYPTKTKWEYRKTPLDAAQQDMSNLNGKKDGWSWEYIIELSNELNKDIWINVHMSCDSNYVAELAKLLKEELNPNINIYVENSNEVWSPTQLTHGPYNKAEADFYGINFDQNYARRTVELSNWFGAVFGQDEINKKIRVILAGQHAYNGRSDIQLNYIKNTFGEPNKYIYATSTALYFQTSNASSTDLSIINDGMLNDIDKQIDDNQSSVYRLNHINKANTWNLVGGCTSYEGGPHVPAGGGQENLGNLINSHRTEKMGDVLKYNYLEGWKQIGGGLAMHFTLASSYNRYGCWGLTDDYTKPDRNYKMQAVRDIISTYTSVEEQDNSDDNTIYPNPASEFIYLNDIVSTYTISNLNGEIVQDNDDFNSQKIDISKLQNGVYFLNIKNKNIKFIVAK